MAIERQQQKIRKTNLFEQKNKCINKDCNHHKRGSNKTSKPRYLKHKTPGMKGRHKVFDQGLSDRYDIKSRQVIKNCLGDGIIDNPHSYGEDMLVLTNRIPYGYIELQVYGKWTTDVFPYSAPYIYERKMRFNPNTLFICFNASFDKAILFSKESIQEKKYRAKKYSREFVHYVRWCNTLTVDVSNISYDKILSYCDPEEYFERLELKNILRKKLESEGTPLDQLEYILDEELNEELDDNMNLQYLEDIAS
jgi:hypothetical protein